MDLSPILIFPPAPVEHRPETPKPEAPVPTEPDTGEGDGITDYQRN